MKISRVSYLESGKKIKKFNFQNIFKWFCSDLNHTVFDTFAFTTFCAFYLEEKRKISDWVNYYDEINDLQPISLFWGGILSKLFQV
jgi:hypothetical protein